MGSYTYVPNFFNDGYLHPRGAAHSHFARLIEGTRFNKRLKLGSDVYAYLFEADERAVAVLSSRGAAKHSIPRPAGSTATDLFGNPLPPDATFTGSLVYLESDGRLAGLERGLLGTLQ